MPALKTYDLFISHAWKYGYEYDKLVNLLDNAPNFHYRNYSAPSEKPLSNLDGSPVNTSKEIKDAIRRKINPVNCVVVISGMYYNHREWMQFEIDYAIEKGKPIVAVKPYGNVNVPAEILHSADIVVNWSTNSIVDAIRKYSL